MTGMQWALEVVLVLLLSATLFHAVRLETSDHDAPSRQGDAGAG